MFHVEHYTSTNNCFTWNTFNTKSSFDDLPERAHSSQPLRYPDQHLRPSQISTSISTVNHLAARYYGPEYSREAESRSYSYLPVLLQYQPYLYIVRHIISFQIFETNLLKSGATGPKTEISERQKNILVPQELSPFQVAFFML